MSVLTFLSLSPAVPGSRPANGERGWSVTEASLAVHPSAEKRGRGSGRIFLRILSCLPIFTPIVPRRHVAARTSSRWWGGARGSTDEHWHVGGGGVQLADDTRGG
jgi:hypothetical protein